MYSEEPNHSKSNQSSGEQTAVVPRLPGRHGKLAHYLSSANLAKVTVPVVQDLAKALAPDSIFPLIESVKPNRTRDLMEALHGVLIEQELTFFRALGYVGAMADAEGLDCLRGENVVLEGSSAPECAKNAFLKHQEEFVFALNRRISTHPEKGRGYKGYQTSASLLHLPRNPINAELNQKIEDRCRAYIHTSCGPGTRVWVREADDGISMVVERPDPKVGMAFVDEAGNPEDVEKRERVTDFVFVDFSSRTAWVTSGRAERAKFYLEVLGELVWGRTGMFVQKVELPLGMFLREGLRSALMAARGGRLERVDFRFISAYARGTKRRGSFARAKSAEGSLVDEHDWQQKFAPDDDVTEIELGIEISSDGPREVIVLKPNSINSKGLLRHDEVIRLIQRIGLLQSYDS